VTERVVVTGAAGFIGSHVARHLLDAGHQVVGIDNFDPFYDRALKESALGGIPEMEFVEADIRDRPAMDAALNGADVIVHLAARAGVRPSIEDPELYASINVGGTMTLLESSRAAGLRRFVFGSSSSVYGNDTPAPFREDAPCDQPISPYAATKRAGELLCRAHAHLYQLRVASLRFFTVYGPRQRPDLAIHRFTRLLHSGQTVSQFGDGSTERDYTYVEDIVSGVEAALTWTRSDEPAFDVFNLGGSHTVRLDRLIQLIAGALGVKPGIVQKPMQPGDVRATWADVGKSQRILGYEPTVTIEQGIPRFVDWYTSQHGHRA
jgi:UDP-glucuronate 4-epimerase